MTGVAGTSSVAGNPAAVVSARREWLALVVLGAGALAGHVAWFYLLSPDPWVLGYGDLGALPPERIRLAAMLVAVQILALALFFRSVRACASRPSGVPRAWIAAAALAHVVTATAVASRATDYPVHVALSALLLGLAWLSVAAASSAAGALGLDTHVARALASSRTRYGCAGAAALAAASINWLVFDGIPHIPDEVVYLLQANYLSRGELYLTGVPEAALDVISTTTHDGRWFGIFPVGWPALLALGVAAGAPELVNPVLTAAAILAAHALIARVWSLAVANLAAFLMATSPWMLFLGASYMAHTSSILFGVLALRGAVEVAETGRARGWSIVGGVALGMVVLIRPFEGVLLGLVCAGVVLAVRRTRSLTAGALAFAIAALAVGGLTLPYNRALTGGALLDPITLYFDAAHYPGSNRLGFGDDVGNVGWGNDALPGHSPLESVVNASWNASLVQIELFGWAFGSLAVVLLALGSRSPADRGTIGARYWSQLIVPLSALTAASLLTLPNAAALRRTAVVATLLGAPVVVTMRAAIKYRDYRGMTRDMEALAREEGFGRDLVLVRGDVFSDYSQGLILNSPGLDGPGPLYFRWVDGEDLSALRARFPDRTVRVVDGASLAGGRPRLASPPMPQSEVPAR